MPAPPYKPRASALRGNTGIDPGPSMGANRMLSPGSVVLGRYTIQKVIGRGGMAAVYLARNTQTERLVALKILDPEISHDPSYVERFRREARAAGRIRSDYVVAIYDLDAEVGGTLVLVMEFLEGQTVQQALRGGRLPIQRAMVLSRHLFEGLAAAHECGVIHRDLKPANLFIERLTGGNEKLKILDFGISKLADASSQELTRAGQTLGTLAYMAPEQIRGTVKGNDPRIDLYSAGVSMFLMLTGKRPIDADDTVQLLQAVLDKPPLTLAEAAGTPFPASLEAFIAKSLKKDATQRFQTALEMRDALIRAAAEAGVDAVANLTIPGAAQFSPQPEAPAHSPSMPQPQALDQASFTPHSGVISVPSAPAPTPRHFVTFEDDEDEGKTVVRAQTLPPGAFNANQIPMVLPAAGRKPTPAMGIPAVPAPAVPLPGPSPMRAPTPPRGMNVEVPQVMGVVRQPTMMGMGGPNLGPRNSGIPSQPVHTPDPTMDLHNPVESTMIASSPLYGQGNGSPPAPTSPRPSTAAPNPFSDASGVFGSGAVVRPQEPTPQFATEKPKRSPMALVLGLSSFIALSLVGAAVFVVVRDRRTTSSTPVAAVQNVAPAAAPTPPAAMPVALPAPTAQPLAPPAQALAPTAQPLAQPLAPPPSEPTPPAPAPPTVAAAPEPPTPAAPPTPAVPAPAAHAQPAHTQVAHAPVHPVVHTPATTIHHVATPPAQRIVRTPPTPPVQAHTATPTQGGGHRRGHGSNIITNAPF